MVVFSFCFLATTFGGMKIFHSSLLHGVYIKFCIEG